MPDMGVLHPARYAAGLVAISFTLLILLLLVPPQLSHPLWFDQGAFAAYADVVRLVACHTKITGTRAA